MMSYLVTRRDILIAGTGTVVGAVLESRLRLITNGVEGVSGFLDGFFNRGNPAYVGREIISGSTEMVVDDTNIYDGDTINSR